MVVVVVDVVLVIGVVDVVVVVGGGVVGGVNCGCWVLNALFLIF